MKHLKNFETLYKNYTDDNYHVIGDNDRKMNWNTISLLTKDLLEIIGVDVDYEDKNPNEDWICKYNIDVIKFLKETFLGKEITFYSKNDKWLAKKKIYDVKLFAYKDEVYINIKLENDWKIIDNSTIVTVYDYDASNKPEHLKLKRIKKAGKYNI